MVDFKSFFRKSGLWLSKSLITILIILVITSYAVSQITTPDFIKPIIQDSIAQQVGGSQLDQVYDNFIRECYTKQTVTVPLDQLSKTLTFNCTEIKTVGRANFTTLFAGRATESLFGDSYNSNACTGYDCIALFQNAQDPLQKISALMNANFNRFVSNLVIYFMIGALICAILILLLAEGLPAKLMSLGYPLAISGLPYFGMSFMKSKLEELLPARVLVIINGLINTLSTAFLIMLIVGIVLLVVGFIAKLVINKKAKQKDTEDKSKKKK